MKYLFFFLLIIGRASFSATPINIIEEGLGVVQVKGALVGSGSLILIDNKIYILTVSHLIQNEHKVKVYIKDLNLDFYFDPSGNIIHQKVYYKLLEFDAKPIFSDPLGDIALLELPSLDHKSNLFEALSYIAKVNLSLCGESTPFRFSCASPDEFKSTGLIHSEKVSWYLLDKKVNQFLDMEDIHSRINKIEDQYISGLYDYILKVPVYGGPGMSGGSLYVNHKLAGIISKVHYDGFPMAYAIPLEQIVRVLKKINFKNIAESHATLSSCDQNLCSYWLQNKNGSSSLGVRINNQNLFELLNGSSIQFSGGPGLIGPGGGGAGSVGSGGGGAGVVGSGGRGDGLWSASEENHLLDSSYFYLQNLPNVSLAKIGLPMTNPFRVNPGSFYMGNQKVCEFIVTKNGNPSRLLPSLAKYIYFYKNDQKVDFILSDSCDSLNMKSLLTAPKKILKARYFVRSKKSDLTPLNVTYDFMESSYHSFSQWHQKSGLGVLPSSYPFQINDQRGVSGEIAVTLFYKSQLNDRREEMRLVLDLNNELVSIFAEIANSKPATIMKALPGKDSGTLRFRDASGKKNAILFSSEDNTQMPYGLFVQTDQLLIELKWE